MSEKNIPQQEVKKHTYDIPPEVVREMLRVMSEYFTKEDPNISKDELKEKVLPMADSFLAEAKIKQIPLGELSYSAIGFVQRKNAHNEEENAHHEEMERLNLKLIKNAIVSKIESGEVKLYSINIGGISKEQLNKDLRNELDENTSAGLSNAIAKTKEFIESEKSQPHELKLIELSVSDLGFPNGESRDNIYKRAIELGFKKCPAETGSQIVTQHKKEPINDKVIIGMEPISFVNNVMFMVRFYDNIRRLSTNSYANHFSLINFDHNDRFIFVRD